MESRIGLMDKPPAEINALNASHSAASAVKMKIAYAITERGPGKSFWTRVGVGFINQDGSITVRLDAVPINGTVQLRDWEPREFDKRVEEAAVR